MRKQIKDWFGRVLLAAVGLCAVALLAGWLFLRGSLARLDGTVAVSGLDAAVSVTRDDLGIVTISGRSRRDVAFATGYVHAQERYFQMDLLRRVAAGELAALVGPVALRIDREHRLHRFRARAESALQRISAADRELLERYVTGVNAGLAALSARPFEYALLGSTPMPWQAADSLLAVWAMYFDLQGNLQGRELARGFIKEHSTPEQAAFLLPTASAWEAPLDAAGSEPLPPIPAAAPAWLGSEPSQHARAEPPSPRVELRSAVGSNNWAVAGSRSASGAAIVANDMHLALRLPHIWFRGVLAFTAADGSPRRIAGVMLPGTPAVVVGSNGRVAWGFTNSYGDYLDLIELERDPQDARRVRTPAGWQQAQAHVETLQVKGQPAQALTVLDTELGPIWEVGGRSYAVRWIAHVPEAVNLELLHMEDAGDLVAAQAVGSRAGIPAQNLVAGDVAGHIGWTIAGPLPDRGATHAASFPLAAADAGLTFRGVRAAADYPRVNDPEGGQLWTANARQLLGPGHRALGDGGADLGARAQQIRDALRALGGQRLSERAVYEIALDDRALFLATWRERALRVLDGAALSGSAPRAEFRRLLEASWDGHASVSSVGYRLARGFLYGLYDELFAQLDAELQRLKPGLDFDQASPRWPVVIARLLDERPAGFLPPRRKDWREVELAAIDATIRKLTQGGQPLAAATWGAHNTARIAHPFAAQLPLVGRYLSAPADPLPGDENMPRVSYPSGGQSERLTVSPGHEEQGILNMPGGQSGHPLSPYFLAGHAAWVRGEPTPLLPGPTRHTLTLQPR
ncbi:MAG: penicillin acylase family protein [Polyangia bacterium]